MASGSLFIKLLTNVFSFYFIVATINNFPNWIMV